MKFWGLTVIALCFVSMPLTQAKAQDQDPNLISFGAGAYDVNDDETAAEIRLEYRHGTPLFWMVKPWVGAEVTSDASFWGGAGILLDIDITDNIYLAPNFGVGLYAQGSSDKDLGSALEFRSQIEAGYQFDSGRALGLAFGHISNAGIDDSNPGTEILNVYYHVPVDTLF